MKKCICGAENLNEAIYCGKCGILLKNKEETRKINEMTAFLIAFIPFIYFLSIFSIGFFLGYFGLDEIIEIPDALYRALGTGLCVGFAIWDNIELEKSGIKFDKWAFWAYLLPIVYLIIRAKKTNQNYAPAIIRGLVVAVSILICVVIYLLKYL